MRLIEFRVKTIGKRTLPHYCELIICKRQRRKAQFLSFVYYKCKMPSNLKIDQSERVLHSSNKVKFKEKFMRKLCITVYLYYTEQTGVLILDCASPIMNRSWYYASAFNGSKT